MGNQPTALQLHTCINYVRNAGKPLNLLDMVNGIYNNHKYVISETNVYKFYNYACMHHAGIVMSLL